MGDNKLKLIAAELITQVRNSVSIDWTLRESARAKIRVMVRRILNRYGYPPVLQEEAVKTVCNKLSCYLQATQRMSSFSDSSITPSASISLITGKKSENG